MHELSKGFAGRTLFQNVSFGINEGERVGLLGPNGAGKSTLLRLLAGLAEADGGTISRKKGLRLGFLEQTPTFASSATLMDTVLEKTHDRYESMGRAYEIAAHLELSQFGDEFFVDQLSGGWKKRVALARELVAEPDLLLLDEPTNHLDVSGILWLEEFLKDAPFSVLMVTHDRLFLQRIVNRVLDLDPRNPNFLLSVNGDYARYLETKEIELAALARQERVQKNKLRREVEWLSRGSLARQTKQRARIQGAADLKDQVRELQGKNHQRGLDLAFGESDRSPKKLIEAKGLSKAYGGKKLFENVDLLISPKTRLALLGDNGSGKSTLIKILLGLEKPDLGDVKTADGLTIAYFEQSRDTLDHSKSVLKNICPDGDYVICQGQPVHVRSYLDRFLFQGIKAELPVAKLSGGEQARLRLAQLMLNSSQVMVLDEPTNDLDADTLDVLEEALKDYQGAVVLVTHDRYFMDAVSNQIIGFPVKEGEPRRLTSFASYYQWENWFHEQTQSGNVRKPEATAEAAVGIPKARMSFKEKFELENIESEILKIEASVAELTELSQNAEILTDHKKLHDVLDRLSQAQAEVEAKYRRWEELEKKKS